MSKDFSDIVFRFLFSLIFLGLGGEHLVKDELIQRLMPEWMPLPRIVSITCGLILVTGGTLIAAGYKLRFAGIILGIFLFVVTATIHAPALLGSEPPVASQQDLWIWDTLQRSNFVKNLCLLGVCIMLTKYDVGRCSLQHYLDHRSKNPPLK